MFVLAEMQYEAFKFHFLLNLSAYPNSMSFLQSLVAGRAKNAMGYLSQTSQYMSAVRLQIIRVHSAVTPLIPTPARRPADIGKLHMPHA